MKILATLTFLFISITSGFAQSSEYKKLLAEKDVLDPEVYFTQLQEFQKANVQFANVYYQLGKIELNNFSGLDPIVERVASRQYIHNVKTNFGLTKNYLDEREIVRNPDWYDAPEMKNKDTLIAFTVKKLDDNYQASIDYSEAYEKLIFHYDEAVTHYLKAREDFIAINNSADNLRQLFLGADDELKAAVRAVGVSFDSSMYNLDIYRDTYQLLPHPKKRVVNVILQEIDHFRMNGITPTNFLADNIVMWDYKGWSDRFLDLIKEEVDGLQEEISNAYQFFTTTNDMMMTGDDCIQANIDDLKFQRIVNLITKYDNESVLIDIFNYLMSKLSYGNLLIYERNCNVLEGLPTDDFLSRKARIYQNIYGAFSSADSLNREIIESGHSQESFQWFFDRLMTGENASTAFANSQQQENQQAFKNELLNLISYRNLQSFESEPFSSCYMEQDSILVLSDGTEIGEKLCVNRKVDLNDSLSLLVASKGKTTSLLGVRSLEEDFEVQWRQSTYKDDEVDFFKVISDSSFVYGGIDKTSWFKHVNVSGAERSVISLKSSDSIVSIGYNDLQGIFTVIQASNTTYTFSSINFAGKVQGSMTLDLPGTLVNMWQQDQSQWYFSHNAGEENSTITALVVDPITKEVTDTLNYQLENTLVNPLLIKNDNESITLVGRNQDSEEELIYALMDYQGVIRNEKIF